MSDFSSGFFALSENKEKIYPFLMKDELFIQYNDMWVGKLAPTDMDEEIQPQTLALSKEVPLLNVMHAEDHGFYLRILHGDEVKFEFGVTYALGDMSLFCEVSEELFEGDWSSDVEKASERVGLVNEEVARRRKENKVVEGYFANINEHSLKTFELFGFDAETINNISRILTIDMFNKGEHEMVYALLDCIGLTKFDFIAYDYISSEDGTFKVLNK